MTGVVFDIKEFAINDGPGIRLTVFLKGCPLRCKWCHNPEGLSPEPQRNLQSGRMAGTAWTVERLVAHCAQFKDCFDLTGGGVTFSGGEATMQGDFLIAAAAALRARGVHVNLDTCGHCPPDVFKRVLANVDLVYYDLKCMDAGAHRRWCGVDNALVLENARALAASGVPYHVRVPMIPGVVDTPENLAAIRDFVASLPRPPLQIDELPYNELAGGKYPAFGMAYPFEAK